MYSFSGTCSHGIVSLDFLSIDLQSMIYGVRVEEILRVRIVL